MKDASPQTIHLSDYQPPNWLIASTHLTFRLSPDATRVLSRIEFLPNPAAQSHEFFLHGEGLNLIDARINGARVPVVATKQGLTCPVPEGPFTWECEVEINPAANTALEGLYLSNGMFCTQCEAEGFRKITYYPDRPDVMTTFTVRIEGDYPVLLSNGNPTTSGDGWAEWHDPWPKPAYLFALVAGDLLAHPDSFTTMSGRKVDLNIYVRPGDEGKCAFGMEALKKSMKWDEDKYGREYDLDIFNIVAVDDFNMGAMENKGLNIFNSSCVLSSEETSTDANFERIEAIIAHEYFHNWTGNRITCRDWFQLCLKEGLTVYRDSQFTSDMRSAPVKRINDVIDLRARQFREDNGPLAHPVRPESFQEINNFYTATVYEKGAEVIGMLKTLVGDAAYYKAVDLYFSRHDGDAATIEDWLRVFEDSTGRDLSRFKLWYSQSGTPRVKVTESFNNGKYTLEFKQKNKNENALPQVIPIAVGLLSPDGKEVQPTMICELTEQTQSFVFNDLEVKPVPSILRGFSAPVILERQQTNAERAFLLAHDTDPFNRWESGQALARDTLCRMTNGAAPDPLLLDALRDLARDETQDPAFRALALALPTSDDIAQTLFDTGEVPDPAKIHQARETLLDAICDHLQSELEDIYKNHKVSGSYQPNAAQSASRALTNRALSLLSRRDGGALAQAQFDGATDMTQQLAGFAALLDSGNGAAAVSAFYSQWKDDRLVIDKWFALQVGHATPDTLIDIANTLTKHPDFNMKNPNRFRALFGALAGHHAGFHHVSGQGYDLLADWLIRLDPINPQTTARMMSSFATFRRYDSTRQSKAKAALERIASSPDLSPDTGEMVGRILQG
ncbi:MAG: aminopeptidase N [Paracoccaceae bacterium]